MNIALLCEDLLTTYEKIRKIGKLFIKDKLSNWSGAMWFKERSRLCLSCVSTSVVVWETCIGKGKDSHVECTGKTDTINMQQVYEVE